RAPSPAAFRWTRPPPRGRVAGAAGGTLGAPGASEGLRSAGRAPAAAAAPRHLTSRELPMPATPDAYFNAYAALLCALDRLRAAAAAVLALDPADYARGADEWEEAQEDARGLRWVADVVGAGLEAVMPPEVRGRAALPE